MIGLILRGRRGVLFVCFSFLGQWCLFGSGDLYSAVQTGLPRLCFELPTFDQSTHAYHPSKCFFFQYMLAHNTVQYNAMFGFSFSLENKYSLDSTVK